MFLKVKGECFQLFLDSKNKFDLLTRIWSGASFSLERSFASVFPNHYLVYLRMFYLMSNKEKVQKKVIGLSRWQ